MSTKKPILAAVLTVLGFVGQASADPADPQASEPSSRTSPAIAPGEPNEAEPGASAGVPGVILLTDGQVVQGKAVQDDTGYLIKTPYGSKRFPRARIERTFQTLREAYEYKASQFPDEDTDERLKLAQWCLAQNLEAEAKVQLQGILKINPKHPPAKAMLEKIEQAEVNLAKRGFDPNLRRTQAIAEDMTAAEGPKELDPAALARPYSRNLALTPADVPDIFSLPRPKALKLMEQFNQTVHPVLQNACAKCHNERYPGNFQLRQVRNRRELNRDTLKLNLEATLQLIDPATPARSEILSSPLRPHGYGKMKRPIFKGSNDPSYRKIAGWVESVCKPLNTDGIRQASVQSGTSKDEERFAGDRVLDLGESIVPADNAILNRRKMIAPPSASTHPQTGPEDFPLVDTSNVESMKSALAAQNRTRRPAGETVQAPAIGGTSPPNRAEAQQAGPDPANFPLTDVSHTATSLRSSASVRIPNGEDAANSAAAGQTPSKPTAQAGGDSTALPESPPNATPRPGTKKKAKTPVKIDPALLERALRAGPKAGINGN